jgi:hypothetical protein
LLKAKSPSADLVEGASSLSIAVLIYLMNNIKNSDQDGESLQDDEDLVFVLSASLVIDSMS